MTGYNAVTHPEIQWFSDPAVLAPLALLAGLYAWRFAQVRREAGGRGVAGAAAGDRGVAGAAVSDRGVAGAAAGGRWVAGAGPGSPAVDGRQTGVAAAAVRGAGPLQAAAFAGGMVALLAALVSPIDGLGDNYLFSAHMVQHVLLGDIAPLLILLGLSRVIMRPATRRLIRLERRLGPLANPAIGIAIWLSLMYLWHVPALYDAATEHALLHVLEHACFFAAGIALWWPLIQPVPMRHRLTGLQPIAYIGAAKAGLAALGLYLAWSTTALYPYYEHTPRIWGLTPVEDQNVGGVIMMVEQSFTLVIVMVWLFVRALTQSEEEQRRRERLEERERSAGVRV